MVDSVGELQDLKRFSEGRMDGNGFTGWHDYGEQRIEWGDLIHLYILSLQKAGEDSVNPQLVFTLKDSPTVHLISGKQFKYKTLLGEKFSREHSIDECFKALVEKFVQASQAAYIDISVKDFLNGGPSFVPKAKNAREILRYRSTVEKRSHEEPLYKDEDKDQKIRLRVWEPGELIDGQYKVLKVYKGGMGVVYIVSELDSSTLYAVKMFQEQYLWDKQIAEMFSHEAQVWMELEKHKNIVQALFVKTFQGCPALFLEYVDGTDLEHELKQGALDIELALDFALQFCAGMNYASEKLGIVHRDIKPSNCLLDKDWILKITDFGLVKIFSEKEEGKPGSSALRPGSHASQGATLGGTLAYMAPEGFSGEEPADTRSDIYSFGIMFYEMLTGRKPIPGSDMMDFMKNHNEYIPVPPNKLNSRIPHDLSTLVLHCIEKKPANRFRNFRELEEALLLVFKEHTGTDYITEKSDSEMSADEWTNKALSLAALGRHEEALKPFDIALEAAPKDAFLWYKKGDSYVALNRLKEAIKCYDKSIMADHHIPQAWVSKGNALFQLQDYEKAMFCFNNALKVDPENDEVWVKKGMYYAIVESYTEAIRCCEKALRINPKLADAWYTKSRAHLVEGELEDALLSSTRALEENPLWGDAWLLQAEIYLRKREYLEAIQAFDKTLELNPDNLKALIGKANSLFYLCRFSEALACYNSIIEKNDQDLENWKARGDCLFHMGEREDALKNFEIILRRSPRHLATLRKMGNILQDLFSFKEARLCYEAALKENPGDSLALYYRDGLEKSLAMIYECAQKEEQHFEKRLAELRQNAQLFLVSEGDEGLEEGTQEKRGLLDVFKKRPKETPEKIKADAVEAYQRGDYEPAVVLFSRLLKMVNDDDESWEMAGKALLKLSLTDEAHGDLKKESLKCFSRAFRHSRDRVEYLLRISTFFENESVYHEASLSLLKALSMLKEGDERLLPLWQHLEKMFETMGSKFNALVCLIELSKLLPDDVNLKIKECVLLEEIGFEKLSQFKARYLLKMASTKGNDISILRIRGIVLTIMGRLKEAVRIFDTALKNDQKDIVSLIQKGDVLARKGENQGALRSFMLASKYRHNDPTIFYFQGVTYEDLEDLDKAIKSYDIALKFNPGFELPLVRKGFCLYKKGQINESLEYYNRVLEKNQHSAYAWEAKGLVMAFQMRFHESEWCFNRALEIESSNISVLKNKAILYMKMELYNKAIESMEAVLALDPLQEEAWNITAICHYKLGDIEEALKCCEKALEIAPRYSRTWVNKGFLLNRRHRYEDALQCFERALEIEYSLPEAFVNRGVTMCLMGRPEEAIADYRVAVEINMKAAVFWYNLGLWYASRNRLEESMKSFDATIALDNTLVDAWVDRAIVQISLNLTGEAMTLAEKAAQIDPKNHRTWFLQGYLMTRQDDRPENLRMAVRNYDKSLRLKGDYIPALVARGLALRQLGREDEAEESFIRARQVSQGAGSQAQEESSALDPEELLKPSRLYNPPCDIHFHYEFSMKPHGHILFQE